jgi:hypothetical protein
MKRSGGWALEEIPPVLYTLHTVRNNYSLNDNFNNGNDFFFRAVGNGDQTCQMIS